MTIGVTYGRLEVLESLQAQDASLVDTARMTCPFCISQKQEVYEVDASAWAVYCVQCEARGPITASRQDAIDRWENHR